jgi:hypothetical protein
VGAGLDGCSALDAEERRPPARTSAPRPQGSEMVIALAAARRREAAARFSLRYEEQGSVELLLTGRLP